jgi:hypothetical protein
VFYWPPFFSDPSSLGFFAVRGLGRAQARGSWRLNMPVNRTALLDAPVLQRLSCLLRIMCIVSIPSDRIRALRHDLKPSISLVIRLIARWSCSTMLFRYLHCRRLIAVS